MAKLVPYTANLPQPDTSFQRITPNSTGAPIAEGVGSIAKGVREFNTQMEEDESRTALVATSQIRAKYAAALDEAQVSGADLAPLKEKMQDELFAVGENLNTRKGQQSLALHSAQTGMMFDDQANRIAVHRAAEAAQLQGKQFLDSESATLRSTPSALPLSLQNVDAFVNTLQRVPPEKKALIREQLVEQLNLAAVMSSTRIDPHGTKTKLENGEWTLTAANRETAIHSAESHIREIRADERAARQDAEYQAHKASEDASQTVLTNLYAGNLKDADIFNNADILPNKKEDLLHFKEWYTTAKGERANKPHPVEMLRLWNLYHPVDPAINPPPYNSTPVLQSAHAGKLSAGEAKTASDWVANLKDENNQKLNAKMSLAMSEVGRAVSADVTLNWSPQNVAAIQMDYQDRVHELVAEIRQRGEKGENPSQIFSTKSKDYIGSPEFIAVSINNIKNKMRKEGSVVSIGELREKDGVLWRYKGGNPTLPDNWEKAPAGTRSPSELTNQIPQ